MGQFISPIEIGQAAIRLFSLTGGLAALRRGHGQIGLSVLVLMTAFGGGLIRDVLVREEPLLFKLGRFYGLAALFGCMLVLHFGMEATMAAGITIGVSFVFRMLAMPFNRKSHSIWREQPTPLHLPEPVDKNPPHKSTRLMLCKT